MTEVPEHLLRRARERRAALTGGEVGAPAGAEPAAGGASGAETPALPSAGAAAPAPAAGLTPAPTGSPPAPAGAGLVTQEPEPSRAAIEAVAETAFRARVPAWVVPVLAILPFWGVLYLGAFSNRQKAQVVDPLVLGANVYREAGCSGCHGASGEGGVGPALQNGGAKLTFPDPADQIAWVRTGSGPFTGKPYGDPNRLGGQRGPAKGVMPAFGGQLSDSQISAVVSYEREKL